MGSAIGGMAGGALGALASGAGKIPSIDLGTQTGNAQDTYNTAKSGAAQTMNTATALNGQSQNTLKNIVGQETPAMANVNNEANTNLQTYGQTFVPLQQQQAQQAQQYGSGANVQRLQGQAVADSNASTQAALANQRAQLESEGVDPASVRGNALDQQAAVAGAAQNAGAATQSAINTQDTAMALTNQANQLGMQVGNAGASNAQTAAGIGSGIVANTNNTNDSNVNNLTAANTYLATGTNANSSAANMLLGQYKANQQTYQDQQQQAGSMASSLGSIAGSYFGMATGGTVPAGVPQLTGGGPITPRGALPMPLVPGTTDTKLIAATPGEFMLPKDVTEHLGHEHLHKLIDKTRAQIAQRKGIPTAQLSSAHTARGA